MLKRFDYRDYCTTAKVLSNISNGSLKAAITA